jgi:hypothetical protein
VQIHGHLGLGFRRTYNSEDSTLLTLPGSIGAGWTLNVSEAGDMVGDGHGPDGLYVPPAEKFFSPLSVTLIDQDGTRHVFQPRALSSPITIGSLSSTSPLATLTPTTFTAANNHALCVYETFSAPAGVHMSLWRYLDVPVSGACPARGIPRSPARLPTCVAQKPASGFTSGFGKRYVSSGRRTGQGVRATSLDDCDLNRVVWSAQWLADTVNTMRCLG